MDRPIGIIVSQSRPLEGQSSRASGNFSTKWYGGPHQMLVEVTVDGQIDNSIVFNIAEDKSGSDPTKARDVCNNKELDFIDSSSLYICEVRSPHNKDFMVTIKPYVNQ
ncbi:DeoR family transcriptional regulator [Clostridium weizhouense]|uniref:DeoR family transcriptional regulator n=1 Tax=Clostridium weizhouense TaxID=2859781 RepID=A0ABS7AUU5_9CLOT|nr:DeoR family transcriptional regulator [Clostridium weizhouense]MBW6411661.1 DeoR family transcriptional regulator [Clostridium weizhouense]